MSLEGRPGIPMGIYWDPLGNTEMDISIDHWMTIGYLQDITKKTSKHETFNTFTCFKRVSNPLQEIRVFSQSLE